MSLDKPLEQINEDDLNWLIENKESERKNLDYKRELSLESEQDKTKFRADASAFANASGGHLIYGMTEKDGFPDDLCGMDVSNPDNLKMRIDEILHTKIHPRIPGHAVRMVELKNSKWAIVIRIPQSFAKPHQVQVDKDNYQFWSRRSAGNYRLDVDELRSIILQSESLNEKIRRFRLERLGNIIAGETPTTLLPGARIVVHLIPIGSFGSNTAVNFDEMESYDRSLTAPMIHTDSYWHTQFRYNLDGYLTYISPQDNEGWAYNQIFRDGTIEMVEAWAINDNRQGAKIWTAYAEMLTGSAIVRALSLQKQLGLEPPIVGMVSLTGVKGYEVSGGGIFGNNGVRFTKDTLLLPDIKVESLSNPADTDIRPILDAIWNAGGFDRCRNYDENGKWKAPR